MVLILTKCWKREGPQEEVPQGSSEQATLGRDDAGWQAWLMEEIKPSYSLPEYGSKERYRSANLGWNWLRILEASGEHGIMGQKI